MCPAVLLARDEVLEERAVGHGPGEVEALTEFAADLLKPERLLGLLDALRDHLEGQVLAERDMDQPARIMLARCSEFLAAPPGKDAAWS